MFDIIAKLGAGGSVGFLTGLIIVSWVEPTTIGGTGLLILIPTVAFTTIGGIISKILEKESKAASEEPAAARARGKPEDDLT